MNQALYAHMNNKRKMKKKDNGKKPYIIKIMYDMSNLISKSLRIFKKKKKKKNLNHN
jgi:hypothetical protein